jgi:nitrite reductase (NO-forming)
MAQRSDTKEIAVDGSKKIALFGSMVVLAILAAGITWVMPIARSHQAPAVAASVAQTTPDYRAMEPNGTVVNVDLTAKETTQEIADGADYHVWTFNGTAPGPVIRVHLGDTIHFTLTNDSSIGMQHSIDFHAAMTPWADLPAKSGNPLTGNYQPVDPGQTKTFDWVAMYPGVFMYHCGVPPVLQHISNGMYGAIIVEPDGLEPEREFVLVSSEFYPGAKPIDGLYEGDLDRMSTVDPQYVVFDGAYNRYVDAPLAVRPGEPFRIWVMNAGPTLTDAFHVIGTMFDVTYADGNPANPEYGLQTFNIAPGSGAMFELNIPDPGLYPFVTHSFAYTGLGAVGLISVDPDAPPAPDSYALMTDAFSAGVQPVDGTPGSGQVTTAPATASPTTAEAPTCTPNGTTLRIASTDNVFDHDCLAAPAGEPFTIKFDNADAAIPHNVAIYTDQAAAEALFVGDLITGPESVTYDVDAIDDGTYFFRCDVHPTTMTGTFVVN